jgi:hypothetical protein
MFLGAAGLIMAAGVMSASSAAGSTTGEQQATVQRAAAGPVLMWEDPNYTGSLYVDALPSECPAAGCDIDGWDGDNEISSVKNQTACTVRLYDNDGFTGGYVNLLPGGNYPNLERLGFDNKAESFKFIC